MPDHPLAPPLDVDELTEDELAMLLDLGALPQSEPGTLTGGLLDDVPCNCG